MAASKQEGTKTSILQLVSGGTVTVTTMPDLEYRVVVEKVYNEQTLIVRNPKVRGEYVDLQEVFKLRFITKDGSVCEQSCAYLKTTTLDSGTYTVLSVKEGPVTSGVPSRDYFRVTHLQPVEIRYSIVDELTMDLLSCMVSGNMSDISCGGMKLHTDWELQKGEQVQVVIDMGAFGSAVEVGACVVYVLENVDSAVAYTVGLKFTYVDNSMFNLLRKYVQHLQQFYLRKANYKV